jgi:hypothetical protein
MGKRFTREVFGLCSIPPSDADDSRIVAFFVEVMVMADSY